MTKGKVIFIVGPTSSGKTPLSLELAEKINAEIISCDSMQIYKGMDILTSAPGREDLSRVPHYLVKELEPSEEYSAAAFAAKAEDLIRAILSREKVPLVVGGTGLYMKALVVGLFDSPPKDEELREELSREAQEKGVECLFERLKRVDPDTCEKISSHDLKRIIRALEVYELTGDTIHARKKTSRGIGAEYECRLFALDLPREILYARINNAVDRMFDQGIIEEVKSLLGRALSLTASKAIGIKEVSGLLEGKMSLEEAKEEMKKNTRRYAKRQLTWFRADKRIEWIDADKNMKEMLEEMLKKVNG